MSGVTNTLYQTPPVTTKVTSVLIVDDHSTFADLLALALNSQADFECIATAATADEAVATSLRARPDLVVMDIQLGRDSGLEAARRIRAAIPDVVIVVVSAHRDPTWVVRAAQAGASAFAPKTGSLSEMLSVLRGARNGGMLIAPSLFNAAAAVIPESGGLVEKLTGREQEVLTLMGRGMGVSAIARLLNISVHTCRGYVKSIHAKLDVRSQLEAVVKGQRLGLIETVDAS
jgi:DNA-binding NarL/FixJ family response regulator